MDRGMHGPPSGSRPRRSRLAPMADAAADRASDCRRPRKPAPQGAADASRPSASRCHRRPPRPRRGFGSPARPSRQRCRHEPVRLASAAPRRLLGSPRTTMPAAASDRPRPIRDRLRQLRLADRDRGCEPGAARGRGEPREARCEARPPTPADADGCTPRSTESAPVASSAPGTPLRPRHLKAAGLQVAPAPEAATADGSQLRSADASGRHGDPRRPAPRTIAPERPAPGTTRECPQAASRRRRLHRSPANRSQGGPAGDPLAEAGGTPVIPQTPPTRPNWPRQPPRLRASSHLPQGPRPPIPCTVRPRPPRAVLDLLGAIGGRPNLLARHCAHAPHREPAAGPAQEVGLDLPCDLDRRPLRSPRLPQEAPHGRAIARARQHSAQGGLATAAVDLGLPSQTTPLGCPTQDGRVLLGYHPTAICQPACTTGRSVWRCDNLPRRSRSPDLLRCARVASRHLAPASERLRRSLPASAKKEPASAEAETGSSWGAGLFGTA